MVPKKKWRAFLGGLHHHGDPRSERKGGRIRQGSSQSIRKKKQEDLHFRMEATLRWERDWLEASTESSLDSLYLCDAVRSETGEIKDVAFTYLNSNVEKMVSIPKIFFSGQNV